MKGFRGLPAVIVHNRDCCYMYEGEGGEGVDGGRFEVGVGGPVTMNV